MTPFDWYFVVAEGERRASVAYLDNLDAAKAEVWRLLAHVPSGTRLSDREIAQLFDLLLEGSSHGRIVRVSETDPARVIVQGGRCSSGAFCLADQSVRCGHA